MNLEQELSNKRALTGYSSVNVLSQIQSLQEKYEKQIKSLKEKLKVEKEMNHHLTLEVERQQMMPQMNPIEEEVKGLLENLIEQHVLNTKSILDIQTALEEQELTYSQELDRKKKQKEAAKSRMHVALDYLKTLPIIPTDGEKEQSE